MLSRLRSKSSWVVTGLGDGIFAEPASHDEKAAEWRPLAAMVDTRQACAMGWATALLDGGGDKGRPAWRSRTAGRQQRSDGGQCVKVSARGVVARV